MDQTQAQAKASSLSASKGSAAEPVDPGVQAQIQADIDDINAGLLVSPSTDFQFIWDAATGERKLFKGSLG